MLRDYTETKDYTETEDYTETNSLIFCSDGGQGSIRDFYISRDRHHREGNTLGYNMSSALAW